ncbi:MAG: ATP-binding protein [Acidobacteriota bacterium]|nr:MAG: ATP-binding protein [Acidobacteriota bacterium]
MSETIPHNLEAVIVNDLTEIGRLGRLVDEFIEGHRLPAKTAFEINLALDELLTNTITYGYDDGLEHRIHIRGSLVDGRIRIEIEDDGRAFNPLEAAVPDLEAPLVERPIGGLGIHLVRQLTDLIEYRRAAGKNIVILNKNV